MSKSCKSGEDERNCLRSRYRTVVRSLLPWCDDPELDLRCSILLLRDRATQLAGRCSDDAAPIYSEMIRLGCAYGLGSTLTPDQMVCLRQTMLRLALAAGELDALTMVDASDDPEKL